jgi:hypothetical protein
MSKMIKGALATMIVCLAMWASALPAHAGQTTNCVVFDNELWASPTPGMLRMHCQNDPAEYRAYYNTTNPDACPVTANIDEVKLWNSMITTGLLAGKKLVVNWNAATCAGGIRAITSVFLNQ